ncbi:uncharacterized protein METZ01_LOCUS380525, partial [marine metagenome]
AKKGAGAPPLDRLGGFLRIKRQENHDTQRLGRPDARPKRQSLERSLPSQITWPEQVEANRRLLRSNNSSIAPHPSDEGTTNQLGRLLPQV